MTVCCGLFVLPYPEPSPRTRGITTHYALLDSISKNSKFPLYYRIITPQYKAIPENITSLLPSVLLRVRSMSNNTDGKQMSDFFPGIALILSYEPSILLHIQTQRAWLIVPDMDSHVTCSTDIYGFSRPRDLQWKINCVQLQGFPIDSCTFVWVRCMTIIFLFVRA